MYAKLGVLETPRVMLFKVEANVWDFPHAALF
jgi:hypothetical protein